MIKTRNWRPVKHPLQLVVRKGWQLGRAALISPRGTVFAFRRGPLGCFARRQQNFELKDQ